jgi:hypothetical protein
LLRLADDCSVPSLVLAFEQALNQKAWREGEPSLTSEERIIVAVEEFEREVNNGGYNQFFINSSRDYAPIIVESLLRIGCPETAKLTSRALAALRLPSLSVASIERVMETDDAERDAELEECSRIFFNSDEPIAVPLFNFIAENKAAIRL